jgi:phosphoribosylglycinamide formyltransferase-1
MKLKVAIFASGTGSNALNLITYFSTHPTIEIACVLTNNAQAGVVFLAESNNISTLVINNTEANDGLLIAKKLAEFQVDYIVLAGYLRKIPVELIQAFPTKIINVHPSLLPKFGGKGMYGIHVHQAVKEAGECESGITIHLVNEEFDKGRILAQFRCEISSEDSVESIQQKVQQLELAYLPHTVDKTIQLTHYV